MAMRKPEVSPSPKMMELLKKYLADQTIGTGKLNIWQQNKFAADLANLRWRTGKYPEWAAITRKERNQIIAQIAQKLEEHLTGTLEKMSIIAQNGGYELIEMLDFSSLCVFDALPPPIKDFAKEFAPTVATLQEMLNDLGDDDLNQIEIEMSPVISDSISCPVQIRISWAGIAYNENDLD